MSNTLNYFKEITKYPRPSKQEEKIRNFLIDFFSWKWYEYKVDSTWNLIVSIPAKNTSSQETIILQAHLDMVCVKSSDSNHNFLTDVLDFYEEDGYLSAKNTTLGADDGIWIALCMSAIDFQKYPALELVFTIDEEAGMSGVNGPDFSLLHGTKIINLDTEKETEICISSAGWVGILWTKELEFIDGKKEKYDVEIFWMKWWHSWIEIDKNRGNAIILALQFLANYKKVFELYGINVWIVENAIPSKIKITLWIDEKEDFENELKNYLENLKNIYDCPDISFKIEKNKSEQKAIKNAGEIVKILSNIQDGIYTMSKKIDWLVQTSLNFGILKTENGILKISYLARSSNNEELENLRKKVEDYLKENDFTLDFNRWYPGWQDNPNSELVNIAKVEFEKVLQITPKVVAYHAGLECWLLVAGINKPWVNAISIGPNIYFPHSIDEKVEIQSINRMEKILAGILEKL